MMIQLALDRLTIEEALKLGELTEEHVDWLEVGTSLIKEYGMDSVRRMKERFPDKTLLADMKTIDNAKYEFELCFAAGADVVTVMGVSPLATVETCLQTAQSLGKKVMIDLLNTTPEQQQRLFQLASQDVYYCEHVSKDEQEVSGKRNDLAVASYAPDVKVAVAGGISMDSLPGLVVKQPEVVIIGSAITKAADPQGAAKAFKEGLQGG
ncbi:3-hexulose-6-phosphate synthase [Paenibacillus senegalimassiliensis]|uniref:3-hexulose-6-phosphate synthase n=1 Tax=Paenibacillus senegalimassiliensis TaxID=1737426 RepID=UPI00073F9280|nr:3-hexulose-6-phosphate synthase [Paenibacillus senegalimassiliensis]